MVARRARHFLNIATRLATTGNACNEWTTRSDVAGYGDPHTDAWEFIETFSPYQNVKKDVDYPPVLFTTSTRDDREHSGHARKMMAKMSEGS